MNWKAFGETIRDPRIAVPLTLAALAFGMGPFVWAIGRWHCWWVPNASLCM